MRMTEGIRYPQPGQTISCRFAASGFVNADVVQVFGILEGNTTGQVFAGGTVLPPTKDTSFWIIQFIRDDLALDDPDESGDGFTLKVYDADDLEAGPILPVVSPLYFTKEPPGIVMDLGNVNVTSPQNESECTEFSAFGTAPASRPVAGSFSPCSGTADEVTPGPNWVLHCKANAPSGCTLTVSQKDATSGTGKFTTTC